MERHFFTVSHRSAWRRATGLILWGWSHKIQETSCTPKKSVKSVEQQIENTILRKDPLLKWFRKFSARSN